MQVPNIEGMSIKDAEKTIKELGLELIIDNNIEGLDKENTIITEQSPKESITINKGNKVYVKY